MECYRELIDDFHAFKEECRSKRKPAVRRNGIKARENFEEALDRDFDYSKSSWNDKVYRVEAEKPGNSVLHWRGEYYVQEESAAYPVEALDPKPGDSVLDMCAAPGGKTTQIADRINNEGLVVANDSSSQRMKSLHANIYRTGSYCVNAQNKDGRFIPEDRKFDKILVDAPCTGEGNRCRRSFEAASENRSRDLSELQVSLLEKAFALVNEGGSVVYSTCTFSPWENEAVVSRAVTGDVKISDLNPGFDCEDGLEEYRGENFPGLSKAVRIYPHHLQSGGMFVAKFRR